VKKLFLLFGALTLAALPLMAQSIEQQKKPCSWEKTTITFGLDIEIERCYANVADKVGYLQTITTAAEHGTNRTGIPFTAVQYLLEFPDSTSVAADRKKAGLIPVWYRVEVLRFDNDDAVNVDSLESIGDRRTDWVRGFAGWHVESDKHLNHNGVEWLPARELIYSNTTGDPKTDYKAFYVSYRFIVDQRHKTAYILSTNFSVSVMHNEPALLTDFWFNSFTVQP